MATGTKQAGNESGNNLGFRLSHEDYDHYINIHINLLLFTAHKIGYKQQVKTKEDFLNMATEDKLKVRNDLMKRLSIIDEFVAANPCKFTPADLEIIKSWKQNHVSGTFYVMSYTENGALFLEEKDKNEKAYLVLALGTPLWEILPVQPPVRVQTVLLPFKGRIVYDGLVTADRVLFGGGMTRSLRAAYNRAIMDHNSESLPYKESRARNDKQKLEFYLSTKESRDENWQEIEELLKNEDLHPTYLRMMGKANARSLKKQLKNVGVKKGWFAVANDVVVASNKNKKDLENLVDEIIPNRGKESVHIFEFK